MGKIVTFYSYKGGTGRSMALANVAWVLASRGARVLVVDWDLEAPGLHRYFRPFLPDKDLTRIESQGLIDLVVDFSERMASRTTDTADLEADWFRPYADISKWSQRLLWPSGQDAEMSSRGMIDFVPAGRQDGQYARRVNSFDWTRFYERYNGGSFMDALRASMGAYDWVLIDSRTGVSDTAGICTVQFPDVLVVCFTLNYQSIDGAAAVATSAKAARANRPLRILPVPTRLDLAEEKLLNSMMRYAQRRFNPLLDSHDIAGYWDEIGVQYYPRFAYSEKLSPFEDRATALTSTLPAMERLTSRITEGRIASLQPLPEPHREQALAEFEQPPDAPGAFAGPATVDRSTAGQLGHLSAQLRNLAWRQRTPLGVAAALIAGLFIGAGTRLGNRLGGTSPSAGDGGRVIVETVPVLASDAREAIGAGRRDYAALLVAEAANRLGADAIISDAGRTPAGYVYEALVELQPFALPLSPSEIPGATLIFSPNGRHLASAAPGSQATLLHFPPPAAPNAEAIQIGYSVGAFSGDSRYIASGGRSGTFNIHDANTGSSIFRSTSIDSDPAGINALAFSPDNTLLAIGGGKVLEVVTVDQWKSIKRDFQAGGGVTAMAFSPDSTILVVGGASGMVSGVADLGVRLRVPLFKQFRAGPGRVKTIVFGGTGEAPVAAILADGGAATLLKQEQGQWTHALVSPYATAVALSPAGDTIVVASDAAVDLIRTTDMRAFARLGSSRVAAVAFSADARWMAVGGDDGRITLFDASDLKTKSRITTMRDVKVDGPVRSLAFDNTGRYLAVGTTKRAAILLVTPLDQSLRLSGKETQDLACSQARLTALTMAAWTGYFPSEPLRFTCGAPVSEAPVK